MQIGGALGTAVLTSAYGRCARDVLPKPEPSGLSRQDIAAASEALRQSIQKGAESGGLTIPEMVRTQIANAYRHAFSRAPGRCSHAQRLFASLLRCLLGSG